MQLNELISQYSLDTIFEKTKIPKEVLEKLSKKEFDKLKRVQVLGFIKIIEREFKVDLSELREEAEKYYATHSDQKPSSAYINILDSDSAPNNGSGFMGIIFGIVTIAIIGYGGWFFYNKESGKQIVTQESNSSKESMFTSTLNSAKTLLGVDSNNTQNNQNRQKLEQNKKEKGEPQSIINNQEEHKKFDVTTQTSQPSNSDNINSSNTQGTDSVNTQESTKEKVEELVAKSTNATKNDDTNSQYNSQNSINLQTEQNNSNNTTQNTLTSNNTQQTQDNRDNLETQTNDNNLAKESATDNTQEIKEDNIAQTDSNTTNANTVTQNTIDSAKLIVKSKRLWIGIYNLKTKKRVSKFIKGSFDFDLSNGDLAIVTGHSMFDLEVNGETKKFGGVKKSYILLSKDEGLKVLTKQEYRKLTKKRAW